MHEEGADARRLGRRVEQRIAARLRLVAAVERTSPTPTPRGDERTLPLLGLDDVIRAVVDELSVRPEDVHQCALGLLRRVVAGAEPAHRFGNQRAQRRHIGVGGGTEGAGRRHAVTSYLDHPAPRAPRP
jgi:hypothetical protein